jgi:hypothetical protein
MTNDWLNDALARIAVLEAEHGVRRTMTRYMALCDVPARAEAGESLDALFAADAVWEGVGAFYANRFGTLTGRAEILAMLARHLPPAPHFEVNAHFLTSETLDVSHDVTRARGRWIMLQASGLEDGRAELVGARLEVDFVPDEGGRRWLIRHFRTERLFDAPWTLAARAHA